MIERFLGELADALPGGRRTRRSILLEAEDHLREAAADAARRGLPQQEAEAEAIRRFGDVRAVARAHAALAAATGLRRAALALVVGLVVALPISYLISENLLPPATWSGDELPAALRWKRDVALLLTALAAGAAATAYALARLGRVRLAGAAVAGAGAAVSLAGGLVTFLAVEWSQRVPGAGGAWLATGAATAVLLAPAVLFGARAAVACPRPGPQ